MKGPWLCAFIGQRLVSFPKSFILRNRPQWEKNYDLKDKTFPVIKDPVTCIPNKCASQPQCPVGVDVHRVGEYPVWIVGVAICVTDSRNKPHEHAKTYGTARNVPQDNTHSCNLKAEKTRILHLSLWPVLFIGRAAGNPERFFSLSLYSEPH